MPSENEHQSFIWSNEENRFKILKQTLPINAPYSIQAPQSILNIRTAEKITTMIYTGNSIVSNIIVHFTGCTPSKMWFKLMVNM